MRQPILITEPGAKHADIGLTTLSIDDLDSQPTLESAFLIVDMTNWQQGWQHTCKVRRSLNPHVYLRPIAYLVDHTDIPKEIEASADAHVELESLSRDKLDAIASRLDPVNRWIDQLPKTDQTSENPNVALKVLRLLASRNQELSPIMTARRNSGFVYPLLEPLFDLRDTSAIDTLDFLAQQKLVTGEFFAKTHLCSHCDCAFLNFVEVCPHCSANDLSIDEMVHHFKCGYTDRMTSFETPKGLSCPKCERKLSHIGVDYDKPSVVYQCNECTLQFQDPEVSTRCFNCNRTAPPEDQVARTIFTYSLSSLGRNAAYYGLEAIFTRILEAELSLYSDHSFREFLKIEAARIKRYSVSTSTLAIINLAGLDKIYMHLGKQSDRVFHEISAVFKAVLRETDVITARNESLFLVIMTETSVANAEIALERLRTGIASLAEQNLKIDLETITKTSAITADTNIDTLLQAFLGGL